MNLPKKDADGRLSIEAQKQLADELEKRGEFSVTQNEKTIVVFDQSFISACIKFLRGE